MLEHFNDFTDEGIKGLGSPYPEVVDGFFLLPTGFGWGIALDYDGLEHQPPQIENGIIRDPGLDMYRNADWNKRSP
jgi:hypothetical protein